LNFFSKVLSTSGLVSFSSSSSSSYTPSPSTEHHFDFPKTFSTDSRTLWQPAQKFSQEEKLFRSDTFTFQTISGLLGHFTTGRKISRLLHVFVAYVIVVAFIFRSSRKLVHNVQNFQVELETLPSTAKAIIVKECSCLWKL